MPINQHVYQVHQVHQVCTPCRRSAAALSPGSSPTYNTHTHTRTHTQHTQHVSDHTQHSHQHARLAGEQGLPVQCRRCLCALRCTDQLSCTSDQGDTLDMMHTTLDMCDSRRCLPAPLSTTSQLTHACSYWHVLTSAKPSGSPQSVERLTTVGSVSKDV
jgi:hypothetical protein